MHLIQPLHVHAWSIFTPYTFITLPPPCLPHSYMMRGSQGLGKGLGCHQYGTLVGTGSTQVVLGSVSRGALLLNPAGIGLRIAASVLASMLLWCLLVV